MLVCLLELAQVTLVIFECFKVLYRLERPVIPSMLDDSDLLNSSTLCLKMWFGMFITLKLIQVKLVIFAWF